MKKTYLDELYTAKDKANKALDALDSWRLKDIAHEDKYTNEAKRKVIQMHINALENLIQIYIDTHKSGITDRTDEPKVNTSSFRVVDGELLPLKEEAPYSVNDAIKELKKMEYLKSLKQKQLSLKEPLTFEQWRDKNFFQFKDSNLWGSYKTEGVFTSRETFEIYRLGNTFL